MKINLSLFFIVFIFTSSCVFIDQVKSQLEIPIAIQKEVHAKSVFITEAPYEGLAAIHITLKDDDIINPKTDLFKVQSIAYKSAYKAYELYTKRHAKSLNNYRVDIAYKDSLYRYYYYDSLQFARKDIYWQKISSFLNSAKHKEYDQLSKFMADSADATGIIKQLKEQNYGNKDDDYHFVALESIEYKNGWITRYWIRYGSEKKYQIITILLDEEKGNIMNINLNPSGATTING